MNKYFIDNRQSGFSLTESLIGLLLMTILGLGIVFITSKNLVAQRYTTTQNITVLHMREYLQTRSNNNSSFSLAGESVDLTLAPRVESIAVSIGDSLFERTVFKEVAVEISADNEGLFGGDGEIKLSHGSK